MRTRPWEVGICGTFDVGNYGDLLFPLIAEAELTERLGSVTLHRFSYHARTLPEWPFEVTSVTALPQMIHRLDGLIIGGGHIVRFDKEVAPGYGPPTPEIHHPTGYWLTPALLALQHDVPVVWNAPGMYKEIPTWADPLMEMVLTLSRYVAVRDESSRASLEHLTSAPVAVVPDTAFRIPRLLNLEGPPSVEFTRLCEVSGLDGPYIVIQPALGVEGFVRCLEHHPQQFRSLRFLALPIGPVLGDHQALIDPDLPGVVRLADWPTPLLIAELIGRSEAVVGQSYHLFITALASGVPVFTRQDLSKDKYSGLKHFETFELPPDGEPDADWFLARIGRTAPSAPAHAAYEALGHHWDRIAAVLRAEPAPTAPTLNRFWQSLPTLLEDAAARKDEAVAALGTQRVEAQGRTQDALRRLAVRDDQIEEMITSTSWRLTAPVRFVGHRLRRNRRRQMIDLERIRRHRLESEPYQWAAIEDLFDSDGAARLSATYPCDHFKLVASYGGEKDYEYEARSLIGMGADVITHPAGLSGAWRALALDLLSPEYRAAMTTLTGCDLSQAPMEVNVFHYGRGGSLGAHRDLPEKLVTHVLYFNRSWNRADGGCLSILRSADQADLTAEIAPIVGHSCVIVRSENSWHAVSRVANDSAHSRRSMTVTFYRPGSVSTMWPPGDTTPLHSYHAADLT